MMQPLPLYPPIAGLLANGQAQIPAREYTPAPAHLVEAIRVELKKIVDDPKLEHRLGELGRLANQSDDLLMCLRDPAAVMLGEHKILNPGAVGVMQDAAGESAGTDHHPFAQLRRLASHGEDPDRGWLYVRARVAVSGLT